MAGRIQMCCVALLAGVSLLCGCNPSRNAPEPKSLAEHKDMLLAKLSRNFEDPVLHFELAQIYKTEGRFDKAKWEYELALTFDPVYWQAQAGVVKVLELKGKTSEADTAAGLYMTEVAMSLERSLALADAFEEQKADKYAVACYQQALRANPKSALVYKRLGDFYFNRNDKVRALQYYRASYDLDWNQPDVARQLGYLHVEIKVQRAPADTTKTRPTPNK